MKTNNIIYGIIIFSLGWLIGLFLKDYNYFTYESDFNLFECFYFIVSIAFAIYVAKKIEKGNQDYRSQKDIILTKIDEVDEDLKKLLQSFCINNRKRYEINNVHILSMSKNIAQLVTCYEKSIETYYSDLFDSDKFYRIKTRKLVRICTYLPSEPSQDITCKNDVWSYSEEKFVEIRSEINFLRTSCFQNKLLLNNQ